MADNCVFDLLNLRHCRREDIEGRQGEEELAIQTL
jgi:hypothetical protein